MKGTRRPALVAVAMGKNRQGSNSGHGSGAKGKPNWTPYLAALGIAVAIAAFYSVPGGSDDSAAPDPAATRSSGDMEGELRRLHAGLAAVAGRGGSGLFGKIQAMADQAQAVIVASEQADSEDERRRILQEGLSSKSNWMATLQDHALGLKKDDADAGHEEGAAPQATGNVVALTRENFATFVAANTRTMVEFYAPWCPHCRKFAPEYAACADQFKGRAAFAIVDGDKEKQLTRVYSVGGYPTLKWMVYGRAIEYEGPRTKDALADWVENRLLPSYVDLESASDAAAAIEQGGNKQAKICAGEGTKDSKVFQAFVAAAEHFRGKIIFTWSPPAAGSTGSLRLHSSGLAPDLCGSHAGSAPDVSACQKTDDVIAWLADRQDLDPDLAQ